LASRKVGGIVLYHKFVQAICVYFKVSKILLHVGVKGWLDGSGNFIEEYFCKDGTIFLDNLLNDIKVDGASTGDVSPEQVFCSDGLRVEPVNFIKPREWSCPS